MNSFKITFKFVILMTLFFENASYAMQRFMRPLQGNLTASLMAHRNLVTFSDLNKNQIPILFLPQEFEKFKKDGGLSNDFDRDQRHKYFIVDNDFVNWRVAGEYFEKSLLAPVYEVKDEQKKLIKYWVVVVNAQMQGKGLLDDSCSVFDIDQEEYKEKMDNIIRNFNKLMNEKNKYPLVSSVTIIAKLLLKAEPCFQGYKIPMIPVHDYELGQRNNKNI